MDSKKNDSWTFRGSPKSVATIALVAIFATLGFSQQAQAISADGPCMQDAYTLKGGGGLNCSANDLSLTQFTVTNADVSEPCTSVGDTWTFSGAVALAARSNERYDLGFYIGHDGVQALSGTCTVGIIDNTDLDDPGNSVNLDGDTCGDFTKFPNSVPISNITASCTDSDSNGFFDVVICSAYDQNAGATCGGISDAVPGSPSKCQCAVINTTQSVPRCATNAECTDDGNACTNEVCNVTGGDLFGCSHVNNTAPCDDGTFCNGTDTCSGGTCGGHAGNPCTGGLSCGNVCNEAADNCFVTAGTACRAASGVCDTAETCTGTAAACPADSFLGTSTVCRASAGTCDAAETCSGTSGSCPADAPAPLLTPCDDGLFCNGSDTCSGGTCSVHGTDPCAGGLSCGNVCNEAADNCLVTAGTTCRGASGVCDVAETCTGTSLACPADSFLGTTTVCRAGNGTCDPAETCSGAAGSCPADAVAPLLTACDDGLYCNGSDTCSGGTCSVHGTAPCVGGGGECGGGCNEAADSCDVLEGGPCTDDGNPCTDDLCDNLGACSHPNDNTNTCDDGLYCDGTETCSNGTCNTTGDPCAGGADCGDTCNEASDTCFDPIGTACTDDNNVCTDDTCDGSGACLHTNNVASCDNGLFCDGNDTCDAGACVHAGDPCLLGGDCANTCNETANTCNEPIGTACTDDSNVCTTDVCDGSGTCQHNANTASCDDGLYCDGVETCSGGSCVSSGDPCAGGPACSDVCNETADNCFTDEGLPCVGECVLPGSGVCVAGTCTGVESVLAPSCRWIVLAGTGPVPGLSTVTTTGVRNDAGSILDGSACGFYSKRSRGIVLGDLVMTAGQNQGLKGIGIKFSVGADVIGDIVTGGSTVKVGHVGTIPGTEQTRIDFGVRLQKLDDLLLPTGTYVDTTGTQEDVAVCNSDKIKLADAVPLLDALPQSQNLGRYKLRPGGSVTINATPGADQTVIDVTLFKLGGRSTLTLNGTADDVIIIRSSGDIRIGYGNQMVLTGGLTGDHVLFYGKGRRCKTGRRVNGQGTWFCPVARKFQIGVGATWSGTALGGVRDVRVRRRAEMTYLPFTGL